MRLIKELEILYKNLRFYQSIFKGAQRKRGTKEEGHKGRRGTKAQRHKGAKRGTKAQRHKGTKARREAQRREERRKGAKAQRHKVLDSWSEPGMTLSGQAQRRLVKELKTDNRLQGARH